MWWILIYIKMADDITIARKRLINENLLKHSLIRNGRGITGFRLDFVIRNPVFKISLDYNINDHTNWYLLWENWLYQGLLRYVCLQRQWQEEPAVGRTGQGGLQENGHVSRPYPSHTDTQRAHTTDTHHTTDTQQSYQSTGQNNHKESLFPSPRE